MNETQKPKRRMSVSRAVKFRARMRSKLESLARKVVREQRSFDWHLKVYHECILGDPDFERAPMWVKAEVRGWMDCFLHFVMRETYLEWRVWEEGRGHVLSKRRGGGEDPDWSKVDGDKGASVWKDTGKVWHGYDPTGEAEKVPDAETLQRWTRTGEFF